MEHRAAFFIICATLCVALLWPCPPALRWVGVVLSAGLALLGLLSALESVATHRRS